MRPAILVTAGLLTIAAALIAAASAKEKALRTVPLQAGPDLDWPI